MMENTTKNMMHHPQMKEKSPELQEGHFLSKNGKITQCLSPYNNQGTVAAQNVTKTTPERSRHAACVQDMATALYTSHRANDHRDDNFWRVSVNMEANRKGWMSLTRVAKQLHLS